LSRHSRLKAHALFALWIVLAPSSSALQARVGFPKKKPKPSPIQTSLQDYLSRVQALAAEPRTTGSLWMPSSILAVSSSDYKARHVGDLVIIRVTDNFSATSNGSEAAQRTFNTTSGVSTGLLSSPVTATRLSNLFSPTSTENLSGKGQAALSSTVSLNISGHVVAELPNGVLVVEAVRDLTLGEDKQTIILHGLVRTLDIASDNSVSSSSVDNLEAEVSGKGIVANSIRQPNVVVRTLLKIFDF